MRLKKRYFIVAAFCYILCYNKNNFLEDNVDFATITCTKIFTVVVETNMLAMV